jgi:hypothetical protein
MTTQDAHDLLDCLRDGADYPAHLVDEALRTTGDIEWTERVVTWWDAAKAPPMTVRPQTWHPMAISA